MSLHQWEYVSGANDWEYSEGFDASSGKFHRSESKIVTTDPVSGDEIIVTELRDENDALISRSQSTERQFDWGRGQYVSHIKDLGGSAIETVTEYHTDPSQPGYGNKKTILYPDGRWAHFNFDSENRLIQKIESWKDVTAYDGSDNPRAAAEAKETTYNYTPLVAGDIPDAFDTRPRTTGTQRGHSVYCDIFSCMIPFSSEN